MLVSLIGNKVITVDDGKAIVNALYKNKTINAEEKETILKAITSDEASTGVLDEASATLSAQSLLLSQVFLKATATAVTAETTMAVTHLTRPTSPQQATMQFLRSQR